MSVAPVCSKGHDRTKADIARGRYSCAGCERDRRRRHRAADPNRSKAKTFHAHVSDPKVPAGPLKEIVAAYGVAEFSRLVAERHGRTVEAVQRAVHRLMREAELSVYLADHYAIGVGRHPVEIWGFDYYADLMEAVDARAV